MRRCLLALVLTCAAAVAGCGSKRGDATAPPAQSEPAAGVQDFPKARAGMTIGDLQRRFAEGPVLAPSVSLLQTGRGRVGFAVFDRAMKMLPGAPVALYVARPDGTQVTGPYPARSESLRTKPQFRSQQSAQDADQVSSVYVADVSFKRRGKAVVLGLIRLDGRVLSTSPMTMKVGSQGATPPEPGDKAIPVHTLTPADVGGDLSKLDTRLPPAKSLLDTDFADVLGRKPVVLTFATPQLCQSRVCGPVVDIVAQAQASVGDKVAFVHQEIYKDNDPGAGLRPQVQAWHLLSEPWTFVIDRGGRVSSRFEGAMSVGELERAIAKVS